MNGSFVNYVQNFSSQFSVKPYLILHPLAGLEMSSFQRNDIYCFLTIFVMSRSA